MLNVTQVPVTVHSKDLFTYLLTKLSWKYVQNLLRYFANTQTDPQTAGKT